MATEFRVVNGTLPTSGTADFTISGFGTPDACILLWSNANSTNNPAADTFGGVGFYDGSRIRSTSIRGLDAQGTADEYRQSSTSLIADVLSTITYTPSFITDGVRITVNSGSTSVARYCTVILIKGATNAYTSYLSQNSTTVDVTAPGFKPDLVFFSSIGDSIKNTTNAIFSFGVTHNDSTDTVTQGSIMCFAQHGVSTANTGTYASATYCAGQYYNDSLTWGGYADTFDSSGFTFRSTTGTSDAVLYLAIELADPDDAWLGLIDTKTSTGTQAYTGVGFQPTFLGTIGSRNTAVGGTTNLGISFGAADASNEATYGLGDEDNVATTDANSVASQADVLGVPSTDGTWLDKAALSSFDSDGFTLNYGTASGAAHKALAFAVGVSGGATNYTLTADGQSYALTGNAATLTAARSLSADVQAYALTGNAAGLTAARTLTATAQSYALTGNDATLTYTPAGSYTLTADSQSYALTGNTAGLTAARTLTATAQSYALTGNDATLTYTPASSYTLTADSQSYALTGNAAGLTAARTLTASPQTYTLTGNDATLTYTPAGSYILAADAGNFALTGVAAALQYARIMAAQTVAFAFTGNDATTGKGYALAVDPGAFTLTGNAAPLVITRGIVADVSVYVFTGNAAALQYSEVAVPGASACLVAEDRLAHLIHADMAAHLIN